jgi:hypothetical protein
VRGWYNRFGNTCKSPLDDSERRHNLCGYRLHGGLCRTHHLLKHHPDWKLRQIAPGIFAWTTQAGRTYTTAPDVHAA